MNAASSASRYVVPVIMALLLPACSTTALNVFSLEPNPRDPTEPKAVELLTAEPTRPYDAIALVSIVSGYGFEEALKMRLIDATARLGGHAAILDAHSFSRNGETLMLSAKVIAFRDSTATPKPGGSH